MSYTDDQHKEWEDFKVKFEKSYSGTEEEQKRKATYFENVKVIEEHNQKHAKGEVTWVFDLFFVSNIKLTFYSFLRQWESTNFLI